jgi:hypothetical protein
MSEAAGWDALSRLEQRALIKLFGGGSLMRETHAVVEQLRARALVDESDALLDYSFSAPPARGSPIA